MEQSRGLKALFIIANAGYTDDVMKIARRTGVMGATILNSRGESVRHESFMGITLDSEKEIIFSVVETEIAEKTMAAIKAEAGRETPAHCVCFTTPVEKVSGLSVGTQEAQETQQP